MRGSHRTKATKCTCCRRRGIIIGFGLPRWRDQGTKLVFLSRDAFEFFASPAYLQILCESGRERNLDGRASFVRLAKFGVCVACRTESTQRNPDFSIWDLHPRCPVRQIFCPSTYSRRVLREPDKAAGRSQKLIFSLKIFSQDQELFAALPPLTSSTQVVIGTSIVLFQQFSVHLILDPPISITIDNESIHRQQELVVAPWHPRIRPSPIPLPVGNTFARTIFPSSRKAPARLYLREKIPISNALPRPLATACLPSRSNWSLTRTPKQSKNFIFHPFRPKQFCSTATARRIFRIASDA